MPKKPVDYNKCMFYRLVCRDPTVKEVYVGHTTSEVDRRATHKTRCTNKNDTKHNFFVYRFIRDHGGWDNWQLIVHEKKTVKDIIEAVLQERYWCEFYNATLNSNVPSRTHAEYLVEYRAVHREERAQYNVKYRSEHREEGIEYRANRSKEKAAYDAKFRAEHHEALKAKSAAYYDKHREEANAKTAAYYAANKVRLHEKHDCQCGGKFTTAGKSGHLKTAIHIAYQATL